MPKMYRRKPQEVRALKTYEGMPLKEIKFFMLGSSTGVHVFGEGIQLTGNNEGTLEVKAGDYIVRHGYGEFTTCSAEEFDKVYEEPIDLTELHYVIRTYGFQVEDAEMMLKDERIRPILLAPLNEQKKSSSAITVNQSFSDKDDIKKIAEVLSGVLSDECIRKHAY